MNRNTPGQGRALRLMTAGAMFAAAIALATAYLFHIPVGGNGGYIHIGDAFIYLAGSLLPAPYACAAAALGGGLADLLSGSPIWLPATLLIKPLNALCFTSRGGRLLCRRNLLAAVGSGLVTVAGYCVAEAVLVGSWAAALAAVPSGLLQPVGSGAAYLLLAGALDRAGLGKRFSF